MSWQMERKTDSQLSVLMKSLVRFHFHLGLQMDSKWKSWLSLLTNIYWNQNKYENILLSDCLGWHMDREKISIVVTVNITLIIIKMVIRRSYFDTLSARKFPWFQTFAFGAWLKFYLVFLQKGFQQTLILCQYQLSSLKVYLTLNYGHFNSNDIFR